MLILYKTTISTIWLGSLVSFTSKPVILTRQTDISLFSAIIHQSEWQRQAETSTDRHQTIASDWLQSKFVKIRHNGLWKQYSFVS